VNPKLVLEPQTARTEAREGGSGAPDHLAEALLYLASFHGRPISRHALIAGLPVVNGRLTAALVERAGERAGLQVEPVQRALADIPSLVLPAMLIMRNRPPVILVGIDAHVGSVRTVDPASGKVLATVNAAGTVYLSGLAILGRTIFAADTVQGRLVRLAVPG